MKEEIWHAVYKKVSPTESVPVALFRDLDAAEAYHCNPAVYSAPIRRKIRLQPAPLVLYEGIATELLRQIVDPKTEINGAEIEEAQQFLKKYDEECRLREGST